MQKNISAKLKIVIILVWALPQISTDIYLPSLPSMAKYFDTTISQVEYTIFFYTLGFSLGALFFGPISDRIGRRPVILVSLVLAACGTLIALMALNLQVLFWARFIQGVALVGVGSTMRAITKDICPNKHEMAKFGAIMGIAIPIAAAIAPVIGGYIEQHFYWRLNFVFLLIYILIFLIYSLKNLPETNLEKLERPLSFLWVDYKEVLVNGQFFRYNAITAFALCSMFAYLTVSPDLLQVKAGLTPQQFGYTNLLISLALIISSYINSTMIYHRGIDSMLHLGVILLGIAGTLFLLNGIFHITHIYAILLPLIILVFGCGFIYPNASAGGLSLFSKSAGTAGSVYACVQMLGGAAGSGFISLMTHYGDPMECLGLLVIIQAIVGTWFSRQLIRHNQPI